MIVSTILDQSLRRKAGVKFTDMLVDRCRRTKVEPSDIPSQQCENVCDQHDHTKFVFVFWFMPNISAQQICS